MFPTVSRKRHRPEDLYRITLAPEGKGPPMAVRMKRFLKSALRRYGLRNVWMDRGDGQQIKDYLEA